MLHRQHHIAVIASDWEQAREFYVNKLGFELIREAYRPAIGDYLRMLRLGETTIEIFIKPDYPERVNNPEARCRRPLASGSVTRSGLQGLMKISRVVSPRRSIRR